MKINRKDYILIAGEDFTIEIWHFIKGEMRRIKAIRMPEEARVRSMVYLEKYKMIVTTHFTQEIRFWKFSSGKEECRLDVGMDECFYTFLIKDKNALGVIAGDKEFIKIVQLYQLV